MNDDQYLLASAYLDGELSADDWARAAADPEVMAIVEAMRALTGGLADVEPPSRQVRDRAIDAALDELRTAPAVRVSTRRPLTAWLGAAAAAVAVLAVGAIVVNGVRGGGDDDGGDFDAAGDVAQFEITAEPIDASDADVMDVAPSADMAAEEGAPFGDAPGEATAERAAEPTVTMMATADDDGDVAGGAMLTAPPSATFDASAPITSPSELSAYGLHLLELEAAGELPPTPNSQCPSPDLVDAVEVLDEASYVVDDVPTSVLVAIDRTTGITLALDPATCAIVADNLQP